MKITVIGLGQMGSNMAFTLMKSGFDVMGVDAAESVRTRLAAEGLNIAEKDVLPASDVYLLSLPKSQHVREVIEMSPGLLENAPAGSVVMDASTSDPASSRELAGKVAAAGLQWLDAPVSGGPNGAANGSLGMLLGGAADTIAHVAPMLDAMTAKYTHVGEPGSGHVVKLVNNYLCAAHLVTTAEAVAMAAHSGVDPSACLAGLNSGSGRSAVSELNFPEWILSGRFDSGFTTGLMRKDLGLARDMAAQMDMPVSLMQQIIEIWNRDNENPVDGDDFNHITDSILNVAISCKDAQCEESEV